MALNIYQKGKVKIYHENGTITIKKVEHKPENQSQAAALLKCTQSDLKKYIADLNTRGFEANRKEAESPKKE